MMKYIIIMISMTVSSYLCASSSSSSKQDTLKEQIRKLGWIQERNGEFFVEKGSLSSAAAYIHGASEKGNSSSSQSSVSENEEQKQGDSISILPSEQSLVLVPKEVNGILKQLSYLKPWKDCKLPSRYDFSVSKYWTTHTSELLDESVVWAQKNCVASIATFYNKKAMPNNNRIFCVCRRYHKTKWFYPNYRMQRVIENLQKSRAQDHVAQKVKFAFTSNAS